MFGIERAVLELLGRDDVGNMKLLKGLVFSFMLLMFLIGFIEGLGLGSLRRGRVKVFLDLGVVVLGRFLFRLREVIDIFFGKFRLSGIL